MFANRLGSLYVLGAVLTIGCSQKNEAAKPLSSPGTPAVLRRQATEPLKEKGTPVDLATAKPDHSASAQEWFQEWKKGREAAKAKYKGKVIELSGEVRGVDDDPYGNKIGYVYLKVEDDILGIRCTLEDREPWLKVGPGCNVRIRGVLAEVLFFDGELFPCVIIESTPNTTQSMSAEALAKEYATDREAFGKKYDGKWLIIEGELESKSLPEKGFTELFLKGQGQTRVSCYSTNQSDFQKERSQALKTGQRIKLCGQVSTRTDKMDVQISRCMLGSPP